MCVQRVFTDSKDVGVVEKDRTRISRSVNNKIIYKYTDNRLKVD